MNNDKELIIEDFKNGLTITELISKYHHSFYTITKYLDEAGLEHSNKRKPNLKNQAKLTEEDIQTIIHAYVNEKKGQVATGKLVGVGPYVVKRVLREHGIKLRTSNEATIISNQSRQKTKKEDYFSHQSHNMAWILGFIASDGTISKKRNTIKIGLSAIDLEILEKIKKEINIGNEITSYITSAGFQTVSLAWTCEQHKKDLAQYNIIPQKTFKLQPPYKLNKKYWIDYIRGYFDGDGSINNLKNGSKRWQICSATPEILEWIINYFFEEFEIPKVKIQVSQRKHPLYYFQYATQSTEKIYKILYTPNSLYLARKKEKFDNMMK